MSKEARQTIASMFSLMERMSRHMTLSEAEYTNKDFLNEAINQTNNAPRRLYPIADLSVSEDEMEKKKIVRINIRPLYPQDIKAIKSVMPYASDSKCVPYKDENGNSGVSFFKYVPLKEPKQRKAKQPTDNKAQPTDNVDVAQTIDNTQNTDTESAPQQDTTPIKKSGLLAKLNAAKLKQQQLSEGLLDKLKAKTGAPVDAQTTDSTQSDNAPEIDTEVMKWLKTYYMGIVNIIEKNPSYDPKAIDELKNVNNLYNIYMSTPTSIEKIYVNKSSQDMKSELSKAISEGNWEDTLKANINPMNLESLVFGNVLSVRNQNAVMRKAASLGLQKGQPNYPTLVMAPGIWYTYFKRQVVQDPKVRYPIVTPRMSDAGSSGGIMGTQGAYKAFGTKQDGFQTVIAYDITDTEPADPTDTTDYITGSLPGVINNLTGELNQAAIDFKNAELAAKQMNLTDEQKNLIEDVQTEDGQAKIFNRALMAYAEQNKGKLNLNLIDIEETGGGVGGYITNVLAITKAAVEMGGYNNPSIVNPMSFIAAFGVACYTVGTNNVLNLARQYGMSSLNAEWKKYSDNIISVISLLINFIFNYLNAVYRPLASDGEAKNGGPVVIPAAESSDTTQTAPLNENIFAVIEDIVNNL